MSTSLRNDELATLRELIRQEARRLGYGSQYSEANLPVWPRRLKRLRCVIRKLDTRSDLPPE